MLAPPAPAIRPPGLFKRIVDAVRQPPAVSPYREAGVAGTAVYSGYVQTRERSPKWTGSQRYVTIADMAVNTSIIAAGVHYFLNLIAHPQWTVAPADEESDEAKAAAELVEGVLHGMSIPWSRVVRRAGTYRFYGFGIQEWTAEKKLDGTVGLKSVEPRPQHTIEQWATTDDGAVEGVWQRNPKTGTLLGLPRKKFLYLVDDTLTDSPEGVGLFRHLAEPWERLKQYYDLEARAFERDLRGIPVGRVPYSLLADAVKNGDMTQKEADAAKKAMEDFVQLQVKQSNTSITIDSLPYYSQAADGAKVAGTPQWGLELLQGAATGVEALSGAITRTQTEMARILTAEHLMMGESSGNRALGEDKSRGLALVANAVLGDIAAGVTTDIVANICLLNGIPEEFYPHCEVEDVAFKDAESVAGTLAKMAQAGAVLAPDDPVIEDVRSLMGVSAPNPVSPEMAGLAAEPPSEEDVELDQETGEPVVKAGDQPRVPAGSSEGGQFASMGGGSGSKSKLEGKISNALRLAERSDASAAEYEAANSPRMAQHHRMKAQDWRATAADLQSQLEFEITANKAAPKTLYVKRRLLNADEVRAWAASQGIATALPPEDMHVTVAFSRAPVDRSSLSPDPFRATVVGGDRAVHQFPPRNTPNGALVLKFASPALEKRWQYYRDGGASWDFPDYQPHVTLTYSVPEADAAAITPYAGPLAFGPEEWAEVDDGWVGEIRETPLPNSRERRPAAASAYQAAVQNGEDTYGNGMPPFVTKGYDPSQPRVPAGSPEGGQFAFGEGGGASIVSGEGYKVLGGGIDEEVYHFTNDAGKVGIEESGRVNPSDGILGQLSYFTTDPEGGGINRQFSGHKLAFRVKAGSVIEVHGFSGMNRFMRANAQGSEEPHQTLRRLGIQAVRVTHRNGAAPWVAVVDPATYRIRKSVPRRPAERM